MDILQVAATQTSVLRTPIVFFGLDGARIARHEAHTFLQAERNPDESVAFRLVEDGRPTHVEWVLERHADGVWHVK